MPVTREIIVAWPPCQGGGNLFANSKSSAMVPKIESQKLILLTAVLMIFAGSSTSCATQDRVDALAKRVAALEEKQKAKETEAADRQTKLENCVNTEADRAYWNYVKLNGTPLTGKPGTYRASQYVLADAAKQKRDKLEECKLLYGPR